MRIAVVWSIAILSSLCQDLTELPEWPEERDDAVRCVIRRVREFTGKRNKIYKIIFRIQSFDSR